MDPFEAQCVRSGARGGSRRDWGRDLSWQTVEIESSQLQDLLQAPVLIMSGSDSFQISNPAADRLRDYVDQGGCLIFEAESGEGCGDASGFTRSLNALIERWFPQTPLERLPPSHTVWTARHRVDPSKIDTDFWVYGVQACCRTAVFYVPQSVSCRWSYGDYLLRSSAEPPSNATQQALVATLLMVEVTTVPLQWRCAAMAQQRSIQLSSCPPKRLFNVFVSFGKTI